MARHEDNPYWHEELGIPMSIDAKEDWESARAEGHLTPEHLILRLEAILDVEFGDGADLGYDEDGFRVSLVAAGQSYEGGVKIEVYPNDHGEPHAHLTLKAYEGFKFRVCLETGKLDPIDQPVPPGSSNRLKKSLLKIQPDLVALRGTWDTYQRDQT